MTKHCSTKMNEILKIICWIVLGVLLSSFVWGIIIRHQEIGHRNFEYIQCNQFWNLAIITNKTDKPLFNCDLILEEGVLEFDLKSSENVYPIKVNYAYQNYVDEIKARNKNELCN